MTADQVRSIRDHALMEKLAAKRAVEDAKAKRQAEWESKRPERVDEEAKKILALVVMEAKKGSSTTRVEITYYPEIPVFFKLNGFICHTDVDRREIIHYEDGAKRCTGKFQDHYILTLEW
jgi:hypothetical protein